MTAAEVSRRADDYEAERAHYSQAEVLAEKNDDRVEATYRKAETYVRQGRYEVAAGAFEQLADANPHSSRAARSLLDAGRAWEKADRTARALAAYGRVLDRYPDSGGGLAAAKRVVALSDNSAESEADLWLDLLKKNDSAELDGALRYYYAKALESDSKTRAILAYEDVARHHPLPQGTYTDEALFRAAELRREAGDAHGALSVLELLVERGDKAAFVGSYNRPAYIEALLLQGRILRDDLKDLAHAKETFRVLPKRFPKSRLVDDALWEYARTIHGEGNDLCAALRLLKRKAPESRYARCEPVFCAPAAGDSAQRKRCESWLRADPTPAISHDSARAIPLE